MYCYCTGSGFTQKPWQNEIQMLNTVGERERERAWPKEICICLIILNGGICRIPLHGFWRKLPPQPLLLLLLPDVPSWLSSCLPKRFPEANHGITLIEHHVDTRVKPINTIDSCCCLLYLQLLDSICFVMWRVSPYDWEHHTEIQ